MSTSSFLETEYIILKDKRDFIDVLKLRIFRWGDYPGLSGWMSSHRSLKKLSKRITVRERRCKTEAEVRQETGVSVLALMMEEGVMSL